MELESSGEDAMRTASGRLTTIEAIKPHIVVRSVDQRLSSITSLPATVASQIRVGAGSTYCGMSKRRTPASQASPTRQRTRIGRTIVRACAQKARSRRRRARLVDAAAKDMAADAL